MRQEYLRAEDFISKATKETSKLIVVTGSRGEGIPVYSLLDYQLSWSGKTEFLKYLRNKLLLQKKPVIWFRFPAVSFFFCASGVYELDESQITSLGFLDAANNKSARGITILIDAKQVKESGPPCVPLIYAVQNKLGPTIIYCTSPKLRETERVMEQSLLNHNITYIMNPWTGFELELL